MPSLYEILKKKQLSKYPPLPGYILRKLKSLKPETEEYLEYTTKFAYDKLADGWVRLLSDD
jgi:hypothetical protein